MLLPIQVATTNDPCRGNVWSQNFKRALTNVGGDNLSVHESSINYREER